MQKYQSRDYCRDIGCNIQQLLDNKELNKDIKSVIRKDCKKCKAYRFHQWLKDKGFEIVKGDSND